MNRQIQFIPWVVYGAVRLDINLLKPSRIEFQVLHDAGSHLTVTDGHVASESPKWLEYVYSMAHPALRWLPTASAKFQDSRLDAPIQQLLTEGGAAMSMRISSE